jgi:hypothetical protein
MSRKIVALLAVFAAVLLVIFIPLGILESRRTPDWQLELGRYLAVSGVSVADIRLVEVAEAGRPGQFAAQMLKPVPAGWTWQGIDRIPPPERVRCIRMAGRGQAERETARPTIYRVLLIGYHSDGLWHAGWLVHQFREDVSEEERQVLLAKLGCDDWVEISARMLREPSGR